MRRSTINMKTKAVFVSGARTPFTKAFGSMMKVDTVALATASIAGLVRNAKIDPNEIDHIIWGNVVLQGSAHNCAREAIIDLNFPKKVTGNNTSMACTSGLNAMSQAIMMIESGHADVVIAGGSDSMSNAEVPLPRPVTHGLMAAQKKGLGGFFKEAGYNPKKWFPSGPALAERSTGKTMGWHSDVMAEMNNVSRAAQEKLSVESHQKAAAAEAKGYFKDEIVPVTIQRKGKDVQLDKDEYIQHNTDKMATKMPTLKTVFRKSPTGTITAATSSPLTDGGSAMLFMSEAKAKQLGYPTDVTVKSWEWSGIDPYPQLLLAPVLGWGPCLKRAGLTTKDIDLFEIHEAFAAQVLATITCLRSPEFFEHYTGSKDNVVMKEEFDFSKLNVNGSSLALGHPFAATGGRIVTSLANELRRSGKKHGLISICAAGGLGGVCILEHTPKSM